MTTKLTTNGTPISSADLVGTDDIDIIKESLDLGRFPSPNPVPLPYFPFPFLFGSRVMIWKQDPTVGALGRRLAYIPGLILSGPRSSRVDTSLAGTTPVARNSNGDFLFHQNSPESDCVHTFGVVTQTLQMWQQTLGGRPIPWAWNTGGNRDRLTVFPRGFRGANAFYQRSQKRLSFGYFTPPGGREVSTSRSLDITAHETGHAILDGLKPGWLGAGNLPQTGAMHESFGDLSAVFLALSQFDQVEAFVALSKANLHAKNFLAAVAEQFGASLNPPRHSGLRNADNNLKLSEVSTGVHSLSQVFTGAIYDIMADIFRQERFKQGGTKELSQILFEVAQHLRKLVLEAILASPDRGATFADVANEMIRISKAQRDPKSYRHFIKNRFTVREVVVAATPLTDLAAELADPSYGAAGFTGNGEVSKLTGVAHISCTEGAPQDRSQCCGTMQSPEYTLSEKALEALRKRQAKGEKVDVEEDLLADEFAALEKAFK